MFAQTHQRVKPICDSVVRLNLRRDLRMFAEAREKYRRDMEAIKDYAWDEGHDVGYKAAKTVADEIIKAKDVALSEQATALSAKDIALSEKDTALSEKDAALSAKDVALSAKDTALQAALEEIERLKAERR